VQHRNKLIAAFIIVLAAVGIYEHFGRTVGFDRAMTKELEYVIEQQTKEIESLKQQLAERPADCPTK
jgi:cell division protein FtsL